MATYIVDMQGFKCGSRFVFGEVCVLRFNGLKDSLVKTIDFVMPKTTPSPAEVRLNSWVTTYHHGVPWKASYTQSSRYEDGLRQLSMLLRDARKVYVKGLEKETWLSPYVPNGCSIVDLADLGMESLKTCTEELKNRCCRFHEEYTSARWNVAAMFSFLVTHRLEAVIKQIKDSCVSMDKTV
jgi:hypothetical protein